MILLGKKITTKEIIYVVLGIIIFALSFYFVLSVFQTEIKKEPVVNIDQDELSKDHILVKLQITNIDPVKGDVQIRVIPKPVGKYTNDSITLNQDIVFYTNSISGNNEYSFKKGSMINPFEVTVDMYDGYLMKYPYDEFSAYFSMNIVSSGKDSAGNVIVKEIPAIKETNFLTSINGYRVESVKEIEHSSGYTGLVVKLERTYAVKMFARFIMLIFWLITFSIIIVMFSIVVRKRKIEFSLFAFLSAMLFALPALRNMQPFIPSIGCLSDYTSFFWAEAVVAISLVISVFTWLKRPGEKQVE
jgi:hypothetical protein